LLKLSTIVGRGLAPAEIKLTKIGKIVEEQLNNLPNSYDYVKIDKYVIMPTHIHAIIILSGQTAGASPRPTLMDIEQTAEKCLGQSAGASPRPTLFV